MCGTVHIHIVRMEHVLVWIQHFIWEYLKYKIGNLNFEIVKTRREPGPADVGELILHSMLPCVLQHVLRVSDAFYTPSNVVSALSDGLTIRKSPQQLPSCDSPLWPYYNRASPRQTCSWSHDCITQALIDQASLECQETLDALRVCTHSLVEIDDLVWKSLDFLVINLKWNACDLNFRPRRRRVVPYRCAVCGF